LLVADPDLIDFMKGLLIFLLERVISLLNFYTFFSGFLVEAKEEVLAMQNAFMEQLII
jgi:hypothetical protein